MDFHEVKEGTLKKALGSVGDGKGYYVVLNLDDEKRTSSETPGKALARIREAVNPKANTVVFVHLEGLSR